MGRGYQANVTVPAIATYVACRAEPARCRAHSSASPRADPLDGPRSRHLVFVGQQDRRAGRFRRPGDPGLVFCPHGPGRPHGTASGRLPDPVDAPRSPAILNPDGFARNLRRVRARGRGDAAQAGSISPAPAGPQPPGKPSTRRQSATARARTEP